MKLFFLYMLLFATAYSQSLQQLVERYEPRFHYARTVASMPFDPNGGIYHNGVYHLMYIYQDYDVPLAYCNYGHLTSTDLFHWEKHDDAFTDGKTFSGNVFKDKSDRHVILYHQYSVGNSIAVSTSDDLMEWEKPDHLTPLKNTDGSLIYSWDPYGWREGGTYYGIFGGAEPTLHKSTDLEYWEDLGSFIDRGEWSNGRDMSTPKFFPLGNKHVFMFIAHNTGAQYVVGTWANEKFTPETWNDMNWPGGTTFAMETIEEEDGRVIVFAWVSDPRDDLKGRHGVISMPRVFSMDGQGRININPPKEVEGLRASVSEQANISLEDGRDIPVENISGDTLEIMLEIEPGTADQVGLKVLKSPGGEEETVIEYDTQTESLVLDVTKSSLSDRVHYGWGSPELIFHHTNRDDYPDEERVIRAPLKLDPGEPLKLRVFIDRSIIEVFANGREAVTHRVYPTRDDAVGVSLFAEGGDAEVKSLHGFNLTLEEHEPIVPVIPDYGEPLTKPSDLSVNWSGRKLEVKSNGKYTVDLLNIKGERMAERRGSGNGSFEFSSMKPGIYIVNVIAENKVYFHKGLLF